MKLFSDGPLLLIFSILEPKDALEIIWLNPLILPIKNSRPEGGKDGGMRREVETYS